MRTSNRTARRAALLALLCAGCGSGNPGRAAEADEASTCHEFVREQWYSWMTRMADHAALLRTHEAARTFVEESMSAEIAKRVTEDARVRWPDIQEDEVRDLWAAREPEGWHMASYGSGTFLLGAKAAYKGGPEAVAEAEEPTTERDAERAELEEKMVRFLKNQEMSRRAKRRQGEVDEVENFWLTLPHSARSGWLLAHYAETSAEIEVQPAPDLQDCPMCVGGVREELVANALRHELCPVCHGVAVVRQVRFQ